MVIILTNWNLAFSSSLLRGITERTVLIKLYIKVLIIVSNGVTGPQKRSSEPNLVALTCNLLNQETRLYLKSENLRISCIVNSIYCRF